MLQTDGSRRHRPSAARAAAAASALTNFATGPANIWNPCRRVERCITVEYRMNWRRFSYAPIFAVGVALWATTIACGSREEPAPSASAAVANEVPSTPRSEARPRIVILGDSLTAGLGLPPEQAYPNLLQQRLDQERLRYEIVNAGVSGDTSA